MFRRRSVPFCLIGPFQNCGYFCAPLPIHLGHTSCAINCRTRLNVLHITITIICSLHSRHQFQAVHGVPFYGVLPRVLGDAALHAGPVSSSRAREMHDGLPLGNAGTPLPRERDGCPADYTKRNSRELSVSALTSNRLASLSYATLNLGFASYLGIVGKYGCVTATSLDAIATVSMVGIDSG